MYKCRPRVGRRLLVMRAVGFCSSFEIEMGNLINILIDHVAL